MNRSDRRAVVAAYKEVKKIAGVYAVRCAAAGEVWVGRSADLAAQRNNLDFQLRHGPNNPAMPRPGTSTEPPASSSSLWRPRPKP
jgi:hypothetical protein